MEESSKDSINPAVEESALSSDLRVPLKVLLVAASFGLFTGLAEGIFKIGWQSYLDYTTIGNSRHVLWMAPLSEAVIFMTVGAVLAVLAWRFPDVITFPLTCFIFAALSIFTLLLLIPQIHIIANIFLALGIAFQAKRIISRRQDGFYSILRVSFLTFLITTIGLVPSVFIVTSYIERQEIANLPAAKANSPNVILITLDTVRARSLSLYGYQRRTSPELERFAGESVVFENAIATSPWTLPSHASILTGRFRHELTVGWTKPLKTPYPLLTEELKNRGYQTAGFIANLEYCTKETGIGKGMIQYEDFPISYGQILISSTLGREISNSSLVRRLVGYHDTLNRKNAAVLNSEFLDWLSQRDAKLPYFALLNYFDAHEPLLPPAGFDKKFGIPRLPVGFEYSTNDIAITDHKDWTQKDAEGYRNAYDNSIAYLDQQLGQLFVKLRELKTLDNTIVIITSDHGESLGEHNVFGHGNTLHIDALHVPLMIRYPPRINGGEKIAQAVSLRNVPATVLDLVGDKGRQPFPGKSLSVYFGSTASGPIDGKHTPALSELSRTPWLGEEFAASDGNTASIVTDRYHYVRNSAENEELYDLRTDPDELRNLSRSPDHNDILIGLRTAMAEFVPEKK